MSRPDARDDRKAASPDVSIALGPRQILGGFALLAALIVYLFRRRKR
jgi:hypothetical protein